MNNIITLENRFADWAKANGFNVDDRKLRSDIDTEDQFAIELDCQDGQMDPLDIFAATCERVPSNDILYVRAGYGLWGKVTFDVNSKDIPNPQEIRADQIEGIIKNLRNYHISIEGAFGFPLSEDEPITEQRRKNVNVFKAYLILRSKDGQYTSYGRISLHDEVRNIPTYGWLDPFLSNDGGLFCAWGYKGLPPFKLNVPQGPDLHIKAVDTLLGKFEQSLEGLRRFSEYGGESPPD